MKEPATNATGDDGEGACEEPKLRPAGWPGGAATSVGPPRESKPFIRARAPRPASVAGSLFDDLAVGEEDDVIGPACGTWSWVTMTMVCLNCSTERRRNSEHLGARRRVEVAGRLVREDDLRPADECPRARHALLPPPRALRRCESRSFRPTVVTTWSNHAWSGLAGRQMASGSRMFSSAVSVGIRWKAGR